MTKVDINKIELEKLAQELPLYQLRWVAISIKNKIVASGSTYRETVRKVKHPEEVVLFKVPPTGYSLAPHAHEVQVSKIHPRPPRSH